MADEKKSIFKKPAFWITAVVVVAATVVLIMYLKRRQAKKKRLATNTPAILTPGANPTTNPGTFAPLPVTYTAPGSGLPGGIPTTPPTTYMTMPTGIAPGSPTIIMPGAGTVPGGAPPVIPPGSGIGPKPGGLGLSVSPPPKGPFNPSMVKRYANTTTNVNFAG